MIVAESVADCRAARCRLGRVAFVPTMGALHAGHLSLVTEARRRADAVAVSIFVNPTQFGPNEDFSRYPRPIEDDLRMCREAGVDLVFAPTPAEMYPPGAVAVDVNVPPLAGTFEGAIRPGHFAGVCRVVTKLFNIVAPNVACFGEKDFQQLTVLRAMVRGLDVPIEIVGCPTLRDPDGLAMSSRNRYLSGPERQRALSISRALADVRAAYAAGTRDADELRSVLRATLARGDEAVLTRLDYATIVDGVTLAEPAVADEGCRAIVAMKVGTTRLIDNAALADRKATSRSAAD